MLASFENNFGGNCAQPCKFNYLEGYVRKKVSHRPDNIRGEQSNKLFLKRQGIN